MAEPRIRTVRHSIRVAAEPERVFQLVAHVEAWPGIFPDVESVARLGFDGTGERVRFHGPDGCWTSVREPNPKRLQVRFRREDVTPPLAYLGGLWLVVPKGAGALLLLDHYYRVAGDDQRAAEQVEVRLGAVSTARLVALRTALSTDGATYHAA
jgi:polyketide cyclase/dehydrase/lipid transport protein